MDDLLYYKDNCQFLEYKNISSERLIKCVVRIKCVAYIVL